MYLHFFPLTAENPRKGGSLLDTGKSKLDGRFIEGKLGKLSLLPRTA